MARQTGLVKYNGTMGGVRHFKIKGQDGVGDDAHQADAPAAGDEPDAFGGEQRPERVRGLGVGGPRAGAGAAVDAEAADLGHGASGGVRQTTRPAQARGGGRIVSKRERTGAGVLKSMGHEGETSSPGRTRHSRRSFPARSGIPGHPASLPPAAHSAALTRPASAS